MSIALKGQLRLGASIMWSNIHSIGHRLLASCLFKKHSLAEHKNAIFVARRQGMSYFQ
jgi:hypothetical protein